MSEEKTTFRVQASSKSDKARRPNNEDFVAIWEPEDFAEREKNGCIYVVADGVGGASVGERASKYAAEKVVFEFTRQSENAPGERLRRAMKQANREIFDYAEDNDMRMATTLVTAVIRGNQLYVANVGDSRAYLIRGLEVTQLTRDHSLVGERVRDGSMTEAEAQASKMKNRLTRSIGGEPEVSVDVFDPITLKPGDKVLLCSDGLTRYALNNDLVEMTARGSAEEIADRLVAFAKKRGGADNVSVVVALYEPSMAFQPTTHLERPVEVTWENITTQPTMPKYSHLKKRSHLPASVYVSLGIAATLVVIAVAVMGISLFNKEGWDWFGLGATVTHTPDLAGNLQAPPTPSIAASTNTPIPSPTPIPLPNTSEDLGHIPSNAPTPHPIKGKVKLGCYPHVFIRSAPKNTEDTYLELGDGTKAKLLPESPVEILGKTILTKEDGTIIEWYLILFDYLGQTGSYWVWADCIELDIPDEAKLIPTVDESGKPIPPPTGG